MTVNVNPGWYRDPNDSKQFRYWNGDKWTDAVAPNDSGTEQATTEKTDGQNSQNLPESIESKSLDQKNKRVVFPSEIILTKNNNPKLEIDISKQDEYLVNKFKQSIEYPSSKHYWYLKYDIPDVILPEIPVKNLTKGPQIEVEAYRDLERKDLLTFVFKGLIKLHQKDQELIIRQFILDTAPLQNAEEKDRFQKVESKKISSDSYVYKEPKASKAISNEDTPFNGSNKGLIKSTLEHIHMNYFNLKGRTPRRYYWTYQFLSIGLILANLAFWLLISTIGLEDFASSMGSITTIAILIYIIPIELGVRIRRLHDIGLSAWFLLIFFIPLANLIFLLYSVFAPSQIEANKYGDQI